MIIHHNLQKLIHTIVHNYVVNIYSKWIFIYITYTDRVHPVNVGGDTGEDGGLLGSAASITRHEAGDTMDVVFPINVAVQRATRVTLHGKISSEHSRCCRHCNGLLFVNLILHLIHSSFCF